MNTKNMMLFFLTIVMTGCIPIQVPTSTVMFHQREQLPTTIETSFLNNASQYLLPTFERNGERLAVYDWRSNEIDILQTRDLSLIMRLNPSHWPKRIHFSPQGNYIVVQTEGAWLDKGMRNNKSPIEAHIDINSSEAVLDWIEHVEIWDINKNKKIQEYSCDDVLTTKPESGWLWASNWTIKPGIRRSLIHNINVSDDEDRLSLLCQNGVLQHWDLNNNKRLSDEQPPPYWDKRMSQDENAIRMSNDRKSVLINVLMKHGLWDETSNTLQFFDECLSTYRQPSAPFSNDNKRVVLICHVGHIGVKLKIWDNALQKELTLQNSNFGMAEGFPKIHGNGVAISPDGKYLAVVLESQLSGVYPSLPTSPYGMERTDLRIWDIDTGKEIKNFTLDEIAFDKYKGVQIMFSPDGSHIAIAGRKLLLYRTEDLVAQPK